MMSNSAGVGAVAPRSAEKSGFSLTCSLLSQYLKEKGSFVDLSLGMARALDGKGKPETIRTMNLLPPTMEISRDASINKDGPSDGNASKSMDLFPHRADFGPSATSEDARKKSHVRETQTGQMTIFYGGKVLVFDNMPADKVTELIAMASKGVPSRSSTLQPTTGVGEIPNHPPSRSSSSSNGFTIFAPTPAGNPVVAQERPQQHIVSSLPIARKNSLHRFLEKRKDRIISRAPYLVNGFSSSSAAAPAKPEVVQPWLGLASQASN